MVCFVFQLNYKCALFGGIYGCSLFSGGHGTLGHESRGLLRALFIPFPPNLSLRNAVTTSHLRVTPTLITSYFFFFKRLHLEKCQTYRKIASEVNNCLPFP